MTRRIYAADIASQLITAGHPSSDRGPAWTPGHRVSQASPHTTRIHHDGPDEPAHLDQYAATLRRAGFTVTAEARTNRRPTIRATHP
ncbi:hypothetical protein [Streptomyces sp. NPDC048659]|uniref:hypothetical protein n=1 Tax=Streptomyces sp. NPDC048659 TaxID=3155489 RepID=UPI0034197BAE